MERKSMGGFIAALRKANGLTQKELAEKLNVSDKAISRWERDECAPDLSVIPVLGEIFGVTADELICGERKANVNAESEKTSPRLEKQTKHLLVSAERRFKNLSYIPLGLSALGTILTILFDYFIESHYLSFAIAAFFVIASTVCEIVFIINSFSSVSVEEIDIEKISGFKKSVIDFSRFVFGMNFFIIFTLIALPFWLSFCTGDFSNNYFETLSMLSLEYPHNILSVDIIIITGAYAFSAYILYRVLWSAVLSVLIKKHSYPETAKKINKVRLVSFALAIVAVFFTVETCRELSISGPLFVKGTVFETYEDFKKYDESRPINSGNQTDASGSHSTASPGSTSYIAAGFTLDGINYNSVEIIEDNSDNSDNIDEIVTDENGNVIDEFVWYNSDIFGLVEGDYANPPITVYTHKQLAENSIYYRILAVALIYAELIIAFAAYLIIKRKKYGKQ